MGLPLGTGGPCDDMPGAGDGRVGAACWGEQLAAVAFGFTSAWLKRWDISAISIMEDLDFGKAGPLLWGRDAAWLGLLEISLDPRPRSATRKPGMWEETWAIVLKGTRCRWGCSYQTCISISSTESRAEARAEVKGGRKECKAHPSWQECDFLNGLYRVWCPLYLLKTM